MVGLFSLLFAATARGEELVYWPRWAEPARDAALRKFEEEHPGVRVVSSTVAGEMIVYQQRLLCGVAGGSPPDVVVADRFSTAEWASRDAFLPLGDLIQQSQREEVLAKQAETAIKAGDSDAADAALDQLIVALKPLGESRQMTLAVALRSGKPQEAKARVAAAGELVVLCQGVQPDSFFPAVWNEAQYEGKTYAVPTTYDDRLLYINEDLLERAGLVDENGRAKPPADWDELKRYAVKLTERGPNGSIRTLGFAPNYGNSWLYLYGWQNGGQFVSKDGKTITLNDPKIVAALQFMKDIYDSIGGIQQVDAFQSQFPGGGALDPFLNGQVAMKIDGSFALVGIADYAPNLRFRAVPAPSPKGMPQITWSGGYAHAIPAGCKNPRLSFELIRFMDSDRIVRYMQDLQVRQAGSRGSTYLPIGVPKPGLGGEMYDRYVKDNPAIPPRIREGAAVAVEMAAHARFRPPTPVGQLLWDEHIRAYEKAVRGTATPQAALDYSTAMVQRQLDAINAEGAPKPAVPWGIVWGAVAVVLVVAVALLYLLGGRRQLLRELGGAEARTGMLCVSPWVFGFLALTAGPMIASAVLSFSQYDILHGAKWVGLENYRILFAHDPLVWKSLLNTGYMVLGVPLGMAVGLGIAILLNQEVKGMGVYRTIFYLPAIVPAVASSILWIWILNPEVGLLNSLLRMVGVDHPPGWLVSDSWVFGSKTGIIVMGLWGAGASMIIWLAGLRDIPTGLYEAASIDGAGPLRQFWNVTLPMLTPYIFFNLLIGIIGTLQIFAQAFIMTQGGPNDSTMFYVYYLFNNAFAYFRMGYASALAWVLFAIILVFTGIQLYFSKKWVQYGAE